MGCCSTAQSDPPDQCSCFQIGTGLLERVDAEARGVERLGAVRRRYHDETDGSDSGDRRRGAAARPARGRASGARARRRSRHHATRRLLVRLVGHRVARRRALRRGRGRPRGKSRPRRPRVVVTHDVNVSTGSVSSVSATQSHVSFGGGSTANSVRNESRCRPGSEIRRLRPRSLRPNASLHSIVMGYAGDEHDEESLGESPEAGRVTPAAWVPTRSIASGCTRASSHPWRRYTLD